MSSLRNIFRALSQIEKRLFLGGIALVIIGLIGLGVFFIKERTVAVPAHSGAYSEGMVGQPAYVNPVLAASDDDQAITRLVFASLRDISERVDTSADGRVIQAHLKQGLVWSDGQPITSDDVVFTLESIQNPDNRSPLAGLLAGVKAERVSALQTNFQLENVALAAAVLDLRPVPKHLYGDIPLPNWRLSNYNLNPVASGPYVFSTHDVGADGFISAYRLTANKNYGGTKPYLQKVNFLFFHNEAELLEAFNSGKVQGFGTIDPGLLENIQRPYDLTRFSTPTVYAVFWNQTTNPALGPIEVRHALDLAIDRAKVLAKLNGYGQAASGPLPPALMPPYESAALPAASSSAATSSATTSVAPTSTVPTSTLAAGMAADPAKILENRGWRKGDDGIWTKSLDKTVIRLEFALTVPDINFLKEAARELAAQWGAFGAKVEVKVLPADASLMTALTNRGYDGLLFGNTVRGMGDLYPFWHSAERFAPGLNLATYRNARVDALLEGLRKESNAEKRQSDLRTAIRLIKEDEPAVFLFSIDGLYVSSKNLEGVSSTFLDNPADRFRQLPQWYMNTTRRLK